MRHSEVELCRLAALGVGVVEYLFGGFVQAVSLETTRGMGEREGGSSHCHMVVYHSHTVMVVYMIH